MTKEQKETIDGMTQFEMCHMWRFAPFNTALLQGECGEYFKKVLKEKGGFSSEISKQIGWKAI